MSQQMPSSKVTAIGVAGPVGQSFAVYEKNWLCKSCKQENSASRGRCSRCKKGKGKTDSSSIIMDSALNAVKSGQEIEWQEVVDPNSYQIYYYNRQSGATQWDRPIELGPAPSATGWFGRGQAGSSAAQLFAEENSRYLTRPSRQQKEFIDTSNYHTEGANEYNIWYGRYNGQTDRGKHRIAAAARCKLSTDAGATTADLKKNNTSSGNKKYFCLHFARGICMKGEDCTYYHRVPLPEDDRNTDELYDCFGRQRHKAHRDDMGGVGSFMQPCRTLYVGGIMKEKYKSNKDVEDACWRHFGEWGELENINVVHRLSVCFPRYRLRTSAEFAKEAMSQQALEHGEILNIRWAHDDPNPIAKEAIERANRDAVYSILQARGINMTPANFDYPSEYNMPEQKRARLEDGTDVTTTIPALAYPDTSAQYTYEQYNTEPPPPPPLSSSSTEIVEDNNFSKKDNEDDDDDDDDDDVVKPIKPSGEGWEEYEDADTGATYFYNHKSGESSWGAKPNDDDDDDEAE